MLGYVFVSLLLKLELVYKLIDIDVEKVKVELLVINKLFCELLNKVWEIIDDIKLLLFIEEIDSISKVLKDVDIDFIFENKELV